MVLIELILIVLVAYLALNAIYVLSYVAAGIVAKPRRGKAMSVSGDRRSLILVPAYRENEVILATAEHLSKVSSKWVSHDTFILADDLEADTCKKIEQLGLGVIDIPNDPARTKAKSINRALSSLPYRYDTVLVLDADNLVQPDVLDRFDAYFRQGFKAIQAQRVAKNENTGMALLDGLSETANNYIFRKGHVCMGMPASLIGSGMAFTYDLFCRMMSKVDAISGFDKQLEVLLMEEKVFIAYAEDIEIQDEKVADKAVFKVQRKRWLYAQWHFLLTYWPKAVKGLLKDGNIYLFDKVLQFALLPRSLFLGVAILTLLPTYWIGGSLFSITLACLVAYIAAMVLSVANKYPLHKILSALPEIPGAILGMIQAVWGANEARGKFLHTPHFNKEHQL